MLGVLGAPGGDVADCLDARTTDVVVPTRERTFAVDLVAVEGDGVYPVGLDVRGGDREVAADAGLAEYLLEGLGVLGVEPELVEEWDRVLRVWCGGNFGLEAVEGHEGHSTVLLTHHDINQTRGSIIGVDNDVE